MNRFTAWAGAGLLVAAVGVLVLGAAANEGGAPAAQPATAGQDAKENAMAKKERGPRKVIVGTSMFAMWGEYPGLAKRLEQLGGLIDDMAGQAQVRYGRSVDIAALPEVAVSGGAGYGPKGAFPLKGAVEDYFAAKAREHNCYIVVPMYLSEEENGKPVTYNACVLMDRKGKVVGIYRKVHAVAGAEGDDLLEGGVMPGKDFPVFQCDFGKVGIQVCFDMAFDDGWDTLARKGAEIVIWSTQSPGQVKASLMAFQHKYYVISSTWRNNASLFDPMGLMIRSITRPEDRVFVEELDLEYVLLPWQQKLRNGEAFKEKYGDKAGYRYSEAEDGGIFWSNDPAVPIARMVKELGLTDEAGEVERNRQIQDRLRGGPPSLK
jgi:predicted amidohydrolase